MSEKDLIIGRGYIDFSVRESTFSDKYKKIDTSAFSKNGVFGSNHGLQGYDTKPFKKESNLNFRALVVVTLKRSRVTEVNLSANQESKLP